MNTSFRALSVGAIALIATAVAAPAVSAQMGSAETDWSEYPGIEYAATRTYLPDFSTLENVEGATFTVFGALQFDTDDNAEAALETVADELVSGMEGESTVTASGDLEHDDLDDDAVSGKLVMEDESVGGTVTAYYIFDQEDEYILMTTAVIFGEGDDEAMTDYAVGAIEDLKDDEPGTNDDITVAADGTSEGGLWDILPDADAYPELEGLTATDQLLYPTDEAA